MMNHRIRCLLLLLLAADVSLSAQTAAPPHQADEGRLPDFRVMTYNVENLFDCEHDSQKNDYEYLPDAKRHWTTSRYREKLLHIATVIAAAGEDTAPELVGLCEVENDSVLEALCHRSPLRSVGYRYVVTASDDPRGIDVALLYKPSAFHLLTWSAHEVPVVTLQADAHARPVLHATGELLNGDTLDVLVCHWPSKLGGARHTEPLRCLAAEVVAHLVDSIHAVREHPYVVMMGDLNETPRDKAVQSLSRCLTNVTTSLAGTYRYRGRWEQLDQFLLSPSLLSADSSLHLAPAATTTSPSAWAVERLDFPFLLEREPLFGGVRPFRTYNGVRYKGGYADHLPVRITLIQNQK